ncbi:MAG: cbb3-type cytochrome c oxidase subunit II [Terracidiphilus sp.]|jgi:cytochrome c oxidase cbb3-type subunit 2
MSRSSWRQSGWQGASLVAITYVYFLIFAQFAFLKRLATLGIAGAQLNAVMAAMAFGGILLSLFVPRLSLWPSPNLRLRIGLGASSAAAFLSLLPLGLVTGMIVSFLIGAGLGLLTVTLVTHLRQWTGDRAPLLLVGLGTGIAYFFCNVPEFFNAGAEIQSITAALLCLGGIGLTLWPPPISRGDKRVRSQSTVPFHRVLACFTALVWLDSAAFFIIQHTPAMKAGTWDGPIHQWTNGLLHLGAALASVWLLSRRRLSFVLAFSFLALGAACLLLPDTRRIALASVLYPMGVSLYSVALVAYPSLLAPASSAEARGRMAGWLYAIAGWLASAMGIGMGQNLGYVPPIFVLVAGAIILFATRARIVQRRKRELALTIALLVAAYLLGRIFAAHSTPLQLSQIERGRQVYISEGCINCHTQYVRPNSPDVLLWGPVVSLQELRAERPPLIGNRRQGPDLAEVGGRRSTLWLKAHFCNPHEVSGASIMPSFEFLFHDQRGDDLVSYLESLHGSGETQHLIEEDNWHLSASAIDAANSADGERSFQRYCATCHSAGGLTRWAASFKRIPPDLTIGPYLHLPSADDPAQRRDRLARMAKFGIHGTDMPGHEYLLDDEIASISLWLSQQIRQPSHNP